MKTETTMSAPTWWQASLTPGLDSFGAPIQFTIDGKPASAPAGTSLLNAIIANGVYVPHLCTHPELPPACRRGDGGGCNLCAVETSERPNKVSHACKLEVTEGLAVRTELPLIRIARQSALAKILGNLPPEARSGARFDESELGRVAAVVGIRPNTPVVESLGLPVVKDEPLFDRDYNLCIDCRRCLIACNDVRGVGCLEIKSVETPQGPRTYVGTIATTLIESGCKFCMACVVVCPSGALAEREPEPAKHANVAVPPARPASTWRATCSLPAKASMGRRSPWCARSCPSPASSAAPATRPASRPAGAAPWTSRFRSAA